MCRPVAGFVAENLGSVRDKSKKFWSGRNCHPTVREILSAGCLRRHAEQMENSGLDKVSS
ncbi:hypothetical protein BC826DRAFT_997379, partial [Russula brevipes]